MLLYVMQTVRFTHALDWNNHYRLHIDVIPESRQLHVEIVGPVVSSGRVERHLVTLIQLHINDAVYKLSLREQNSPYLTCRLPDSSRSYIAIDIRLGGSDKRDGELFGSYRIDMGTLSYAETFHKLTVFETRMLGNERLYRWLPYTRYPMQKTLLRTDLHTHSSAQITADGLLDVAITYHIPYPTRLLDVLSITYDTSQQVMTPRFFFPPTDAHIIGSVPDEEWAVPVGSLSDEARGILAAAMSVRTDTQVTFGDLEMAAYRYRTPISKHPDAQYGILLVTAQEYAKFGVEYAEITATTMSLLKPDSVSSLHEWLPEIARETGVQLRFLAGLPRNLPPPMLEREVETLLLAAASPYIVGVDFMGFEDNKITQMEPYIKRIASWASAHDSQFTLRIHAGENRKNLSNVRESLRMALHYGMRIRIGHAAHGLDEDAITIAEALSKKNLVMIEFNPDSNLALNNIDRAEELEITTCIDRGIPFVICSDGSGLFHTSTPQLEAVASFGGVGPKELHIIAEYEEEHITREQARFAQKLAQLPANFLDDYAQKYHTLRQVTLPKPLTHNDNAQLFREHLNALHIIHDHAAIQATTSGKKPVLILGATGARYWEKIQPEQKERIKDIFTGLVAILDPKAYYFLIGRPKDEGLTALLSRRVQTYNADATHQNSFALISATVQADQTMQSFTPGLTHVLPLEGSLFTVPNQLVDYVHQHHGIILFIGGGTFVRDAILIARDCGVIFGLMDGPQGASTDKAVMMPEEKLFNDLNSLEKLLQRSRN